MASLHLGLPCHILSAPRVPTPSLCKTVHFTAVPLRRILFHCCAFALLFLARPSPCHSDLRLLNASQLYAILLHIRTMQFLCYSLLYYCFASPVDSSLCHCFADQGCAAPLISIAERCCSIPLQFIALQLYSARYPCRSELCFSIAYQLIALPSRNHSWKRYSIAQIFSQTKRPLPEFRH